MLATKGRYQLITPTSVPTADECFLADSVARRAPDLSRDLLETPTLVIEEAGTAFLVARAELDELSLLLHAHPHEVEIGVAEEPTYPLLSLVATLRTPGAPRHAGVIFDVDRASDTRRFRQVVSQPFVDVVFVDPDGRFLAAYRFELTLWSRAQAHRALDHARRYLDSLPADRRSFRIAMDEIQAYITRTQTA